MNKIIIFIISFFFFVHLVGAQTIINESPNSWTLVLNGERIKIQSFGFNSLDNSLSTYVSHSLNTLEFYALEIIGDRVYAHGFCRLRADTLNHFILQSIEPLPIFLLNLQKKEIFVEQHKTSILLSPGEKRELRDAYVTHDGVIELKIIQLEDDSTISPTTSWYEVFFQDGVGVVLIK